MSRFVQKDGRDQGENAGGKFAKIVQPNGPKNSAYPGWATHLRRSADQQSEQNQTNGLVCTGPAAPSG